MKDSSVSSKDILDLLRIIGESTEQASATVGMMTELVKEVNNKVPLHDLLEEFRKFLKNEFGPSVNALVNYVWERRMYASDKIMEVYGKYRKELNPSDALALTMATMQFWESSDTNFANGLRDAAANGTKAK